MCTHPCFHKTPGCLGAIYAQVEKKENGVEADLQEFQDFDEFEDQASDLPQSAACGGLFTLATFRLCVLDLYYINGSSMYIITYSLL